MVTKRVVNGWLYTAGSIILIVFLLLLRSCIPEKKPSGGNGTATSSVEQADSASADSARENLPLLTKRDSACARVVAVKNQKTPSPFWFGLWTTLGSISLLAWAIINYIARTGGWDRPKKARPRGWLSEEDAPPFVLFVILFVVPVLSWMMLKLAPIPFSILWNEPLVWWPAFLALMGGLIFVSFEGSYRSASRVLLWMVVIAVLMTSGWTYLKYKYDESKCKEQATPEEAPPQPTSSSSDTFSILIGRDWTEQVEVPSGHRLRWDRANLNVAYQARTQTGEIRNYPRGDTTRRRVRGRLTHVQFRVTEPGVDTLRVHLKLSRIDESSRGVSLGIHIGVH